MLENMGKVMQMKGLLPPDAEPQGDDEEENTTNKQTKEKKTYKC